MNASDIIAGIDSGFRVHDINPDSPWSWALKNKGSPDFPEIRERANEILAIKPNNHTSRKFTGGKDSITVVMTVYNSMNIMLPLSLIHI